MSDVKEWTVQVNGKACRVWAKGAGAPLGYLGGFGGLPKWPPILERLAASRRVIAPSPPGFPGATGHEDLDTQLDWVLATADLLTGAGLEGADLVGVSVGGALAAEVAAIWPGMVRRLVLVSPCGLFDEAEPSTDVFAVRPGQTPGLLCAHPEVYEALTEVPAGTDPIEWQVQQARASAAAARLLWPMSDTRLAKRLPRIGQPTLLLWGSADRVMPPSYAQRFQRLIGDNARIVEIPGAGHLADLDEPQAVSREILDFLA